MLDRDLAEIYNCKNGTKAINQAVKRNMERFPERFMFQLNEREYYNLRSQIGTANYKYRCRNMSMSFLFFVRYCIVFVYFRLY